MAEMFQPTFDSFHSSEFQGSTVPGQELRGQEWHTISVLHLPAEKVEIIEGARPLAEPALARSIREVLFSARLQALLEQQQAEHPTGSFWIAPHKKSGKDALFGLTAHGEQRVILFDGKTLSPSAPTLTPTVDGGVILRVHAIDYSEWTSCTDILYTSAFEGLPLPCAGVGLSVLIETSDGMIPLTQRSSETPVYPNRLYSPGGGPKPGESTVDALVNEMLEETGLVSGQHFNTEEIVVLAYVSDTNHQGSAHERPEFVSFLPVELTSHQMQSIRDAQVEAAGSKPTDVKDLVFVPSDPESLRSYLEEHEHRLCPPTAAALAHLLFFKTQQT